MTLDHTLKRAQSGRARPSSARGPLVILTRPDGLNHALESVVADAGYEVLELPALQIESLEFDFPDLSGCSLIIFVSPSAVRVFFERWPAGLEWPSKVYVAAPGTGTARTLSKVFAERGWAEPHWVLPARIGVADAEAMWEAIEAQAEVVLQERVLLVRGAHGRDWLLQQLQQRRCDVQDILAYTQAPAIWPVGAIETLREAQRNARRSLWLISSSISARFLREQLRRLAFDQWASGGVAVVIHERIVPACTPIWPKVIVASSHPDAFLRTLESLA